MVDYFQQEVHLPVKGHTIKLLTSKLKPFYFLYSILQFNQNRKVFGSLVINTALIYLSVFLNSTELLHNISNRDCSALPSNGIGFILKQVRNFAFYLTIYTETTFSGFIELVPQ